MRLGDWEIKRLKDSKSKVSESIVSKSNVSRSIVSKSNVSKSHSLIIQERIPPHENP